MAINTDIASSVEELIQLKYKNGRALGWRPRLRLRFGYLTPDDLYEASVSSLAGPQTAWLDVGCGRDIFPSNRSLAQVLAERCRVLVGLDPSDNIDENELVHKRVKARLTEFAGDGQFDLVTMRMVAEHITDPEPSVESLSRLCRAGGRVVVYTVYKWSPGAIISALVPFRLHHLAKRIVWGTEEKDTFPTAYKMNTRKQLRELFERSGFGEEQFHYLDDCSSFSRWKLTNRMELWAWRAFHGLRLHYPEVCLLGVYRKTPGVAPDIEQPPSS